MVIPSYINSQGQWETQPTIVLPSATISRVVGENMGAIIAPTFSASTTYAIGDYVMYNNKFYKFKAAHSAGAWNSSHVDEITVSSQFGSGGGTGATIDDTTTSTTKTWSSSKINTQITGLISDSASDTTHTWSASKINTQITGLINDSSNDSTKTWSASRINVLKNQLAPAFSTKTAYAIGDYVTYGVTLYKFTSAHSAGAWNSAHATAVTCSSEFGGGGTSNVQLIELANQAAYDALTTEQKNDPNKAYFIP